jgi:hypothetical protein
MKEKIQVTKDKPDAMRQRGYLFGGSTSDETILAEIRRDYLATGGKDVAFTRGKSGIIYWVKR